MVEKLVLKRWMVRRRSESVCVFWQNKQTKTFWKQKKTPMRLTNNDKSSSSFFFFSSFLFNFHHLSFSRYKHQRLNNNNNEAILIYSNVAWFHRLSFYRRCASWRGKCFFLLQLPFIIVALLTSLPQLSNVIKGMDHQQQTLLLNWQVSNPGYSIIFLFFWMADIEALEEENPQITSVVSKHVETYNINQFTLVELDNGKTVSPPTCRSQT